MISMSPVSSWPSKAFHSPGRGARGLVKIFFTPWNVPRPPLMPSTSPFGRALEMRLAAAAREVREEVGLDVDPADLENRRSVETVTRGLANRTDCFVWHPKQKPEARVDHREIVDAEFVPLAMLSTEAFVPALRPFIAQLLD